MTIIGFRMEVGSSHSTHWQNPMAENSLLTTDFLYLIFEIIYYQNFEKYLRNNDNGDYCHGNACILEIRRSYFGFFLLYRARGLL